MGFIERSVMDGDTMDEAMHREFVLGYLKALGARFEWTGPHMLRCELTRDQIRELENRPAPTWYTANHLPELSTLYLWLTDELPKGHENAERATNGSWRADLMRRSVERIGSVTRLRMTPRHPASSITYVPVLCLGFQVAFCCAQRNIRLLPVAVNMVTGQCGGRLARYLLLAPLDSEPVDPRRIKRKELRYKHAFEIATEWVKEEISTDPATWAWYYRAAHRLQREAEQLEAYFAQRLRDGESDLEQASRKAHEELNRRFRPRVEARPVLAALIYCPENQLPPT